MSSPSLYRRHRPRTFADVVGQEHIVRTLTNAIEQGKIHHAYLFVGSRGTGKTSMAKILASCLNCEQAPTVAPCGRCESCRSIAAATSLDVIEMDAASNNSVDDIRELRERVNFAPASGHYKVYILDEAHMLTTQAWNAFLKTLEEPPPNTVFVLATTEAQKVLPTVVDRCHRFDFGRPSVAQITEVLERVAEREQIVIPPQACALIARSAQGSFRDALGTLEQLLAYSGNEIALDDALAVLGVADSELLFEIADAVATGDARAALVGVAKLAQSGRDIVRCIRDLEAHFRELMVVGVLGEIPAEIAVTPEHDRQVLEQAGTIARATVVETLDVLARALAATKDGADARVQLELALTRTADIGTAVEPVRSPPPTAEVEPEPGIEPESAVEVEREPEPATTVEAADLESLKTLWPAVLDRLRDDSIMLATLLADSTPVALVDSELQVGFPKSAGFLKRKAEDRTNKAAVSAALKAVSDLNLRLEYVLTEEIAQSAVEDERELSEQELLDRLVAEFGAEEIVPQDVRAAAPES